MDSYIYIGKIVGTHGIKGEIKILSDSEIKDQVFCNSKQLYIGPNKQPIKITSYRHHQKYEMITMEGYNNINQVLDFIGQVLYAKRNDILVKDYLLNDLIGMEVKQDQIYLGKVVDIIKNSSNILLKVQKEKYFYIPKVDFYIENVDPTKKIINVKNTEGLML